MRLSTPANFEFAKENWFGDMIIAKVEGKLNQRYFKTLPPADGQNPKNVFKGGISVIIDGKFNDLGDREKQHVIDEYKKVGWSGVGFIDASYMDEDDSKRVSGTWKVNLVEVQLHV